MIENQKDDKNPEDEARDILSSKRQDETEMYLKYADLLNMEYQELQNKIDETIRSTNEIDNQFSELFRSKIFDGRYRNESLIKIQFRVKAAADWADELISNVQEQEREKSPPKVYEGKVLDQEIAEITTLIDQLNLPQESSEKRRILDIEADNVCRRTAIVKGFKAGLISEVAKKNMEKDEVILSLEMVLSEKMAEAKSLT